MESSTHGKTEGSLNSPSALIRRVRADGVLSAPLLLELQHIGADLRCVAAGTLIIREGAPLSKPVIVQDGWALRFRILKDGRRQVIDFLLPGDCIGLHPAFRRRAMYSVQSLMPLQIATIDPDTLDAMCAHSPDLLAALARSASRAQEVLEDRMVSLGRRTARERIAHLLVELCLRLCQVGLSDGANFVMPLNQQEIADALGLSAVHVSRTLTKLKGEGLLRQFGDRLELIDVLRLAAIAEMDEQIVAALPPNFIAKSAPTAARRLGGR